MKLDKVIEKLNEYKEKGCRGNIGITLSDSAKVYMLNNIDYAYDILEAGTEGIIIEAVPKEEYFKENYVEITYGTILKAYVTSGEETDTVMLVNNMSAGNGYNCLVLDLGVKEIIADCKDIEDFVQTYEVTEVMGYFDDISSFSNLKK